MTKVLSAGQQLAPYLQAKRGARTSAVAMLAVVLGPAALLLGVLRRCRLRPADHRPDATRLRCIAAQIVQVAQGADDWMLFAEEREVRPGGIRGNWQVVTQTTAVARDSMRWAVR